MQEGEVKNERKKIGFFITKGVWGGAQKYVYSLAISLPKDEYDVFVVTGAGEILRKKLEEKGVRTYVLEDLKRDISLSSEIKSFKEVFKILKTEKPDILHLNSPKASGLGSLAGRLLGIRKIITTIHGFTWNEDRDTFSRILIYIFSWVTILLCNKTITLSPFEESQALRLPFIARNKIVVIGNGIEPISFVEKEDARKKLLSDIGKKDAGDVVWMGTLAELHKNKGQKYLIEALSRIKKPFIFFILGDGEEKETLEKLVSEHGLENRVFFPGFIDSANQYLKAFDIFTLTSIKEGLPYTILEAGLASLPVIASSVGGIPNIIENNVSGKLASKGSVEEITSALEYLISYPEKRTAFGENLRKRIENDFSLEKMLEKTIKLYK